MLDTKYKRSICYIQTIKDQYVIYIIQTIKDQYVLIQTITDSYVWYKL